MRQKILQLGLLTLVSSIVSLNASLSKTQPGVVWDKTAFSPSQVSGTSPALYLGTETIGGTDEAKTFGLARATLVTSNAGAASVKIDPLATTIGVTLNGVSPTKNPLDNQKITNLALQNSLYPIVTFDQANDKNVYLIAKPVDASNIVSNGTIAINDAAGNETGGVSAIVAGSSTIFAAVSENGQTWDSGDARGVAVLQADLTANIINVYDATNFATKGASNKAAEVSLQATKDDAPIVGPIAFVDKALTPGTPPAIASALIDPDVNMFYNSNLERLYIGIDTARRNDDADEGGVLGILMGRTDTTVKPAGSLTLQPVINGASKGLFYDDPAGKNIVDRVVGFYADGVNVDGGDKSFIATVSQINAMRTSTGKDYLLVNSLVSDQDTKESKGIFALPLLGTKDALGKAPIAPDKIGTVSAVDGTTRLPTFNSPPAAFDQMPIATDSAVKVNDVALDKIAQMFVEGDTVYFCENDGTNSKQSGIFSSSAIFDESGAIRAWTPSQRVMGSVQQALGGGLDTKFEPGDYYALTTETFPGTDFNTVKITQWGESTVNNLSDLLANLFPVEKGGVVGLYSFDEKTPGFAQDQFAMMVAVGFDKIALIQTARDNGGQFELVTNFIDDKTDPNQNVFVFDASDPVLKSIMPLTGAEVSRKTAANRGWVFVCGLNGVAVLSLGDGKGWTNLNALSKAAPNDFPGGSNWTFKLLNATNTFSKARKLVAANGRMYVVTLNDIFFFDMNIIAKFKGTGATVLGDDKVAGPIEYSSALIADLVVLNPAGSVTGPAVDNRGVIATDKGLFASALSNMPAQTAFVQKIGDLALELQLIGTSRSQAPATGNVYALATDFENNNDQIYRFDVPNAKPAVAIADLVNVVDNQIVNGKLAQVSHALNGSRQEFMTDGTFVYSTLPKSYGSRNYLNIDNASGSMFDITPVLDLDLEVNTYISGVLRDGASGAIMVPGDWGVRVNE